MRYADFLSRLGGHSSLGEEIATQTKVLIPIALQPQFIAQESTIKTRREGKFFALTATTFFHGEYSLDSASTLSDRFSLECFRVSEMTGALLNLGKAQNFHFESAQHIFRFGSVFVELDVKDPWEQTPQVVTTFVTTLRQKAFP